MKTIKFTGMLSSTEHELTRTIAVTLSLATITVIASTFQGVALIDSTTLIAMLGKAFS